VGGPRKNKGTAPAGKIKIQKGGGFAKKKKGTHELGAKRESTGNS